MYLQWDPLPQDEIVTAVSQAIRDTISIFSSGRTTAVHCTSSEAYE